MNAKELEMQIQKQTQKDVGNLKHDVMQLIKAFQIMDGNMRQSHMSLLTDLTSVQIRINFLFKMVVDELKLNSQDLEEKFRGFDESERKKVQEQIQEALKKKEEEEALKNTPTEGLIQ
jgi:hypothetical protein